MGSVFDLKNYGRIKIDIKSVMDKKRITRNKLSTMTGANYNVITRYYNNDITRIDTDVLARICHALECDVAEVIKYETK